MLYRIRFQSLHDNRVADYEDGRVYTGADVDQECERLNLLYQGCVHHYAVPIKETSDDASAKPQAR